MIAAITGLVALWYPGDGGDGDGRSAASNQENSSKTSGTTPTRVPVRTACPTLYDVGVRDGVCVVEVIPGSPAATAGVKVGDIITDVGGRSVEDVDEFQLLLKQTRTGGRVLLFIVRDDAHRRYVRVDLERIEGSKLRLGVQVEDTVPQRLRTR